MKLKKLSILAVLIAVVLSCFELKAQEWPLSGHGSAFREIPMDYREMFFNEWTDGYEFVQYINKDEKEVMGIKNAEWGENVFLFAGGSPHEGGAHFWLTLRDGKLYIKEHDDHRMFFDGTSVDLDSSRKHLIFRDKDTKKVVGTMQILTNPIRELMINDMLRFILAGKYYDAQGNEYEFFANECRATGFPFASQNFVFGEEYEIPSRIIVFDEAIYGIEKTRDGIDLIPMVYDSEHDTYENAGTECLSLKKVVDNNEREYPLLSEQILTRMQIDNYAGENKLEALAIMRNEIYAAHGYIFSGAKYRNYFGSKGWYSPQSTDVVKKLTEIELINIEHIQKLEADYKLVF